MCSQEKKYVCQNKSEGLNFTYPKIITRMEVQFAQN